jgi:hypothetical protein
MHGRKRRKSAGACMHSGTAEEEQCSIACFPPWFTRRTLMRVRVLDPQSLK